MIVGSIEYNEKDQRGTADLVNVKSTYSVFKLWVSQNNMKRCNDRRVGCTLMKMCELGEIIYSCHQKKEHSCSERNH